MQEVNHSKEVYVQERSTSSRNLCEPLRPLRLSI
jgi:hypothetical protein